ncbi:hypothetical protein [Embleya sp. NPDC005971]|uniref:hypothetical protein n=1 Tax=Embleya sp. NPDC005971 TaxID=3156724 RepID=UPI0033E58F19
MGLGDPDGTLTVEVATRLEGLSMARVRAIRRDRAHGTPDAAGEAARGGERVTAPGVCPTRVRAFADRAFETWIHTGDPARHHHLSNADPTRMDQLPAYPVPVPRHALDADGPPVRPTLTAKGLRRRAVAGPTAGGRTRAGSEPGA